jgi:hypothetical protein
MLAGTIASREYYGPPGYGETPAIDRRERQAVLLLDQPTCVDRSADGNDGPETGQKVVTLVPLKRDVRLAMHLNQHVKVRGKLFHAISGHHHTPLLIQLRHEPQPAP